MIKSIVFDMPFPVRRDHLGFAIAGSNVSVLNVQLEENEKLFSEVYSSYNSLYKFWIIGGRFEQFHRQRKFRFRVVLDNQHNHSSLFTKASNSSYPWSYAQVKSHQTSDIFYFSRKADALLFRMSI